MITPQYGTNVYNAALLAAEEVNANGGFNGYQIEILDAGDDMGDPEKAVNAYNDLLERECRCWTAPLLQRPVSR